MVCESDPSKENAASPKWTKNVLSKAKVILQIKDMLPLILSILAFVFSVASFYYTTLRPSHLTVVAGSPIHLSHGHLGQAAISLPLSFANLGAKLGSVQRVMLAVRFAGGSRSHLLIPSSYQKLTDNGEFRNESLPHPITLAGGERIEKQVLFWGSVERPDEFVLTKPGTYQAVLLAWVSDADAPQPIDSFQFDLNEPGANKLSHFRLVATNQRVAVEQAAWSTWEARDLSAEETASWFKDKR